MSGYLTAVGDAVYVTFEVTVDATVQFRRFFLDEGGALVALRWRERLH